MRALVLLLCGFTAAPAAAGTPADSLVARARALIAIGDVGSRVAAVRALDEATTAAPDRADVWLAAGRAASDLGRSERARACFEKATRLTPRDPGAWDALGGAWKDEWLTRLDRASLDRARECYRRAGELAPDDVRALTAVAMLAVLRGEPRDGLPAGLRANTLDPADPLPMLAIGAALFRAGALPLADSAFRAAQHRLDDSLATRFRGDDYDWTDPDLTTPENEARLDYETRFALATFLFGDGDVVRWDERAELFVRYGPPGSVEYDPALAQLGWDQELEFHYAEDAARPFYAPSAIGFPYDLQVWNYPALGMSVELWDRFLTRTYELPYSRDASLEPAPDPDALAHDAGLIVVDGGRAVFRATPPNTKPYPLVASCASFPSGRGVRLLGSLCVDAADSAWGAWALADAGGRVVARETQRLAPSSCSRREAFGSFTADLAPGRYRVDFAAWDGRGRRGVEHLDAEVARDPIGPRLSDLVLLCDPGAPLDRLEPDFDARIAGGQLTLYCEIDGLLASEVRPASFAYRTRIFALDRRGRRGERAVYDVTREEQNAGGHRRQFVTAPVRDLPPGRYELVLDVVDHASASEVSRALKFSKERG